jgi:N-acetylglucosaminyl-diphospho-decaprenol L-rhamnosyltransferase
VERTGRDVAIVIVTYNSARQIEECLRSVPEGCGGVRLVAVVVVDNASADASLDVAARCSDLPLRLIQTGRNGGYAAGINAGVAAVGQDVDAVLVLNPDIRLKAGSVAPLVAALGPGRGVVVPRLVNPDGSLQPSLRRAPSVGRAMAEAVIGGTRASRLGPLGELIVDEAEYARPRSAAWATGGAMLISTATLRAVGPWDESLLLYGEETEFALRAGAAGHGLWFEPASEMIHLSGDAYATSPMLFALLSVNRVTVFGRWHGRLHTLAYRSALAAGLLLRAAAGRATARAALTALLRPGRRLRALPG